MKVLELKRVEVLKEESLRKEKEEKRVNKIYNNIIIEEGKGKLLSPFNFLR
jgi:hypothetical protein